MKDKEAVKILMKMLKKPSLGVKEKEAILAAVGILSWTSLSEGQIKAQRARREKDIEWKS